jgi:hypothetical protein
MHFTQEVEMSANVIRLDQYEIKLISELLMTELDELRDEIWHTDNAAYKEELKDRERNLHRLIGKFAVYTMKESVQLEMS